jgi:hypothetical protein
MEIDPAYRTQYVLRKGSLLANVQSMCHISGTPSPQAFRLILCFKSLFTCPFNDDFSGSGYIPKNDRVTVSSDHIDLM